jgi:hypothetical protein
MELRAIYSADNSEIVFAGQEQNSRWPFYLALKTTQMVAIVKTV